MRRPGEPGEGLGDARNMGKTVGKLGKNQENGGEIDGKSGKLFRNTWKICGEHLGKGILSKKMMKNTKLSSDLSPFLHHYGDEGWIVDR